MSRKTASSGNFDGIAPFYDTLAWVVFGRKLQQAQLVWLYKIPANASILLVGGGTGWLLEQVLTRCRPKRVVYLETSLQMIARASRRILDHAVIGLIDFRTGDATALLANEQFDIILTPFVLDLFTEEILQTTFIPSLQNVLKTNGLWIITDFIETDVCWQKILLQIMIRFFRLTARINVKELADWQPCLAQAGLLLRKRSQQVGGMVSAEVWEK